MLSNLLGDCLLLIKITLKENLIDFKEYKRLFVNIVLFITTVPRSSNSSHMQMMHKKEELN